MKNQRSICLCVFFLLGVMFLCGCTKRNSTVNSSSSDAATVTETSTEQTQGTTVTGVIAGINTTTRKIYISDATNGWNYTMQYDNDTQFVSRYGETIAPEVLQIGEIADVAFTGNQKLIKSITLSFDAWEYEDVKGLTYNQSKNQIIVHGEQFAYTNALVLYDQTMVANASASADAKSEDEKVTEQKLEGQILKNDNSVNLPVVQNADSIQETSADATENGSLWQEKAGNIRLSKISNQDTVTCRGVKGKICSIVVTKGHGYVRLSNYSSYIGGMIAIGDVMAPVTQDMCLTVPVGNWTLEIDKDGKMGTREIVVNQNEDQTVNLANIAIVACQRGRMHFITDPVGCTITIDGKEYYDQTDFILPYGTHKVSVSAVGYKAYNGSISLKSAYINVNVALTKMNASSDPSASTSRTTAQSVTTRANVTTEVTTETATTEYTTSTQEETKED